MTIEQLPPLEERCMFCRKRKATKLCDFMIGESWNSIDFQTKRETCDRQMCDKCATNLGEEFDFCPIHTKLTKEKLKIF